MKILINKGSIESCTQKNDAVIIVTKTSKILICENYNEYDVSTYSIIQNAKSDDFIELQLKGKCEK